MRYTTRYLEELYRDLVDTVCTAIVVPEHGDEKQATELHDRRANELLSEQWGAVLESYRGKLSCCYRDWQLDHPSRPEILCAIDLLCDHVSDTVRRELDLSWSPFIVVKVKDAEDFQRRLRRMQLVLLDRAQRN